MGTGPFLNDTGGSGIALTIFAFTLIAFFNWDKVIVEIKLTTVWVDLNFKSLTIFSPTLGVTVTTSYNYEFNLLGNNFGCTTTPSPISGTVSISPTDKITLLTGNDNQIVCVNNTPTPTFAFTTIEYDLGGGANAVVTITYSQDGAPTQSGLPPGFGYSLTASNTIRIQGAANEQRLI